MPEAEHKFSECAKKAIQEYYPKGKPNKGAFMSAQRVLSIELILCHFDDMDAETRARASLTLSALEAQQIGNMRLPSTRM